MVRVGAGMRGRGDVQRNQGEGTTAGEKLRAKAGRHDHGTGVRRDSGTPVRHRSLLFFWYDPVPPYRMADCRVNWVMVRGDELANPGPSRARDNAHTVPQACA
jgi:hypothetical protein